MHVPCVTWVATGIAKQNPDRLKLTSEELQQLINANSAADEELLDSEDDSSKPKNQEKSSVGDEIDEKYDMASYDADPEGARPIKGLSSLVSYMNIDGEREQAEDSDDSEMEGLALTDTDNLLVIGRLDKQGEYANMEVHVYNATTGDYYIHHDYLIGSFPLCMETIGFDPGADGSRGNLLAIGTMEPVIEIWDLDLMDAMEPAFTLGEKPKLRTQKRGKKKSKSKLEATSQCVGHSDAVLSLAWNSLTPHVLASGSADHTVALWDLSEGHLAAQLRTHSDKVQSLCWHPREAHCLLSGDFDGQLHVCDARSPDGGFLSWSVEGEVESCCWDTKRPYYLLAATDTGAAHWMDSRRPGEVLGGVSCAHVGGCHGLVLTEHLLLTCGADGKVRVWKQPSSYPDTTYTGSGDLLLAEKSLGVGALLCLSVNPDHPYILAFGGEQNLALWDVRSNSHVKQYLSACGVSDSVLISTKKMDIEDTDDDDDDDDDEDEDT